MPMVTYQTLTKLAYEVADQKGASFDGIEDGASFTRQVAALWNRNKDEWKQMTKEQARSRLNEVVTA